ncbi:MAG: sugar ABC transporter permease, partial [Chloroflexi bacterium]|nr:sugar ABC transporter permease [Chloroflexota bacterium]
MHVEWQQSAVLKRRSNFWKELTSKPSRVFFAFITPWMIGFLVFTAWPMLGSLYYSMTSYKVTLSPEWVGLNNYRYLLTQDLNFKMALTNSLVYTVLSVPLGIAVSLLLATLLNQKGHIHGLPFWRALFYVPTILPAVASSYMFQWIFSYRYGPISAIFRFLGQTTPNFFTTDLAHWVIILFSLWHFGPGMIIFLAGLQGIPQVLYEAASIDGANRFQTFRHITLPGMSPVIFFQFTNGLIGSMQMFQ